MNAEKIAELRALFVEAEEERADEGSPIYAMSEDTAMMFIRNWLPLLDEIERQTAEIERLTKWQDRILYDAEALCEEMEPGDNCPCSGCETRRERNGGSDD